jgi:hypothetical protein
MLVIYRRGQLDGGRRKRPHHPHHVWVGGKLVSLGSRRRGIITVIERSQLDHIARRASCLVASAHRPPDSIKNLISQRPVPPLKRCDQADLDDRFCTLR